MAETKLVSAEEARKLLAGATPGTWIDFGDKEPYPGEVMCYGDGDNGRLSPICRDPHMDDRPGDRTLIAAAPDLAATVVRLHDILAAERGERAPEGWVRDSKFTCDWSNHGTGMRVDNVGPGKWQAYLWTGQRDVFVGDVMPTALEAIEAADRAAGEVEGG